MPRYEITTAEKGQLENHEGIMIAREQHTPNFIHAIAFEKNEGFTGGLIMHDNGVSEAEIIRALDSGVFPVDGSISVVEGQLSKSWAGSAIMASRKNDRTISHMPLEFAHFITAQLPTETLEFLEKTPWLCQDFPDLNYFAAGDAKARRQAAMAMPLSAKEFMRSQSVLEKIDAKLSLKEVLPKALGISPNTMGKWLKVERMAAESLAGGTPFKGLAELSAGNRNQTVEQIANRFDRLNSAQFPKTIEHCLDADNFLREMDECARKSKLGLQPFDRIRQGISHDGWAKSRDDLKNSFSQQDLDYLGRISLAIRSAIVVGQVRESAPGFLEVASAIAERVWQEEPIDPHEAGLLGSYIAAMKGVHHYFGHDEILTEIGMHIGMKDVHEFNTRWHHVQATMDNDMMATAGDMTWEKFVGCVDLGDGWVGREQASTEELRQVGDNQRHCVGGYTRTVLNRETDRATLILTLEKGGHIHSTAEIRMDLLRASKRQKAEGIEDRLSFKSLQHLAHKNRTPSREALAAHDLLIARLNDLPFKDGVDYLAKLHRNTGLIRDDLSRMVMKMKANVTNPDLAESAISIHAEILPKKLRGLGWKDWLDIAESRSESPHKDLASSRIAGSAHVIAGQVRAAWETYQVEKANLEEKAGLTCN
ncbi:hypothetical protein ACEUZ9_004118 [Paracoccus litorisediminis]|uniref:hypothetical protein n=1 Tax=Paracoccus litorisediminis TaxID=2006130 RepID=UPI00372E2BFC